jgi:hypothetical protein
MATANVKTQPVIYKMGGAVEDRKTYTAAAGAIVAGDFIRITNAGLIEVAAVNSAGAVHGIALAATAGSTVVPVILFAPDTHVLIQCIDGVEPEDLTKGLSYTLEKGTGVWGVTATTTNGVAQIVGFAGDSQPWKDPYGAFDEAQGVDENAVIVRFTAATLDGRAATAL